MSLVVFWTAFIACTAKTWNVYDVCWGYRTFSWKTWKRNYMWEIVQDHHYNVCFKYLDSETHAVCKHGFTASHWIYTLTFGVDLHYTNLIKCNALENIIILFALILMPYLHYLRQACFNGSIFFIFKYTYIFIAWIFEVAEFVVSKYEPVFVPILKQERNESNKKSKTLMLCSHKNMTLITHTNM